MIKKIKITPFPNLKITEEAYQRDIIGNTSNSDQKAIKSAKTKEEIKVMVNYFNNGERLVNFAVPIVRPERTFLAVFPNPILLYLTQAIHQFNVSEQIERESFVVESLKVSNNSVLMLNSNSDNTNDIYNLYLQYRIGAIIMLVCSLEAFINSLIPDSFIYVNDKGMELNKVEIQLRTQLKEKIVRILPAINKINIKDNYPTLLNRIIRLNKIRNEFVHLKNYSLEPFSISYHKLFKDMQKFDIEKHILAIKEYMNLLKPEFIKDEE